MLKRANKKRLTVYLEETTAKKLDALANHYSMSKAFYAYAQFKRQIDYQFGKIRDKLPKALRKEIDALEHPNNGDNDDVDEQESDDGNEPFAIPLPPKQEPVVEEPKKPFDESKIVEELLMMTKDKNDVNAVLDSYGVTETAERQRLIDKAKQIGIEEIPHNGLAWTIFKRCFDVEE